MSILCSKTLFLGFNRVLIEYFRVNDLAKELAEDLAEKQTKQKLEKEASKFIAQGKKEEKKVIIQQLIASGMKKAEVARMLQMPLQELATLLA